jgi:TetR/AcrR family transcriptional regulator
MARRMTLDTLRSEAARYRKPQTEREARIIEAATRLFGGKGYAGTRTAAIAAAAGVTERTLFRYFPTKESLYRRVMFPAVLSAAIPTELADTARLFASDLEKFSVWERRILRTRLDVVRQSAPQFRLLLATLMTDGEIRNSTIALWRKNLWSNALASVRRYQRRRQVRSDVSVEAIARAIIVANVGYIVARALLAPEGDWNDDADVDATVELLLNGVARR